MTTKEFTKSVAESPNVEKLKSLIANFKFNQNLGNQSITGISTAYKFIEAQNNYWAKQTPEVIERFRETINYFSSLKQVPINLMANYGNNLDAQNQIQSYWASQFQSFIDQRQNRQVFSYETPEIQFLISLCNENPLFFNGALCFITRTGGSSISNNPNDFIGYMLAYEFYRKGLSEISNRSTQEKKTISDLTNKINIGFTESEKLLIEHIKETTEKYVEFSTNISEFKEAKENEFNDWYNPTKESFNTFETSSKENILELERVYGEKLKLSKPAEYWEKRAYSMRIQGWICIGIITLLTLFSAASLIDILMHIPKAIEASFFEGDRSAAIRWSIILITLISLLTFLIRAIAKVMFSSFHLSRDAEERHTLTYFYLALLKDTTVEKEDRSLIMQSLFSRADTGLLKEDSSPTMPSDIVGKAFGKVNN